MREKNGLAEPLYTMLVSPDPSRYALPLWRCGITQLPEGLDYGIDISKYPKRRQPGTPSFYSVLQNIAVYVDPAASGSSPHATPWRHF